MTCGPQVFTLNPTFCLQELRPYQESMKLHLMPSLLEFFSYVFAAGNLLAGPFFEFRDYIEYIERRVGSSHSKQVSSVHFTVWCQRRIVSSLGCNLPQVTWVAQDLSR